MGNNKNLRRLGVTVKRVDIEFARIDTNWNWLTGRDYFYLKLIVPLIDFLEPDHTYSESHSFWEDTLSICICKTHGWAARKIFKLVLWKIKKLSSKWNFSALRPLSATLRLEQPQQLLILALLCVLYLSHIFDIRFEFTFLTIQKLGGQLDLYLVGVITTKYFCVIIIYYYLIISNEKLSFWGAA